jgi:hypothetical protein
MFVGELEFLSSLEEAHWILCMKKVGRIAYPSQDLVRSLPISGQSRHAALFRSGNWMQTGVLKATKSSIRHDNRVYLYLGVKCKHVDSITKT